MKKSQSGFWSILVIAVLCFGPLSTYAEGGYVWTTRTSPGSRAWKAITTSLNGQKIVAAAYNGYVYVSDDAGATWATSTSLGSRLWKGVSITEDGNTIFAASVYLDPELSEYTAGYLFKSTDGGSTWATTSADSLWASLVSTTDGSNVAGLAAKRPPSGYYIIGGFEGLSKYVNKSTDGGSTLATSSPTDGVPDAFQHLSMSYDGTKLASISFAQALSSESGNLFTSSNGGTSWTENTQIGEHHYTSLTSSSDGTKLAVTVSNQIYARPLPFSDGYIYLSTDSGNTWASSTSAGSRNWSSISSSADGSVLVAAVSNGYIYVSKDSGVTWTRQTSAGSRYWSSVKTSPDGSSFVAITTNGYIYTASTDLIAPEISNTSTSAATTTISVSFDTDESATSSVSYWVNSTSSAIIATSSASTSHPIVVSNLRPCTKYNYFISATDPADNTSSSSVSTLFTTGCPVSSLASTTSSESVTNSSGDSLSLHTLDLSIPSGFASTTDSADFQASEFVLDDIVLSLGSPTGKSPVGSSAYLLSAFPTPTSTLSIFTQPIIVTISYTDEDVEGIDTSTLVIYRHDGDTWNELFGCTVDTNAKTVSCPTTEFSTFAIFGEEEEAPAQSSSSGRKSGSARSSVATSVSPVSVSVSTFTRDLSSGTSGEDVRSLQKLLNSKGFLVTASGPGSIGNETTIFGPATQAALSRFQASLGLPATGYFGPMTRAALNGVSPQVNSFTRDLSLGTSGEDVRSLQKLLNTKGFIVTATGPGSVGNESNFFGPATQAALAKFQAANGLPSTGYFGPMTRNLVAQ